MIILFCTEQFYPLSTEAATLDYGLTSVLARQGHQVYMITSSHSADGFKIKREGVVHYINDKEAIEIETNLFVLEFEIVLKSSCGGYIGECEAYKNFMRSFECDLLVISGLCTWSFLLILDSLLTLKAKRKVVRVHEEWILVNIQSKGRKAYIKKIIFNSIKKGLKYFFYKPDVYDKIFTLPALRHKVKNSLKYFDKVFFLPHPQSRIDVYLASYCSDIGILPNGVFEKDIHPPKILKSTIPNQDWEKGPYLLALAHFLVDWHTLLLDAFYASSTKLPLILAGGHVSGYNLQSVQAYKSKLDTQHGYREVYLLHVNEKRAFELLQNTTLFLHAASLSSYKSFPVMVLKSLSFGVPIICMGADTDPDLVVKDSLEMAHMIDCLLNNPDYYNGMATSLHARIKNYTYEKIAQELIV
ncbi:glycosyltransferase family 4 protein [Helicobacter suis]|uniref:glycosyltransferase family 4 protein n=1 Tax=Helicobacter suis TaxID=104628 RepID=UPI0013D3C7B3|nr:glycosyltransferase family 4 protein [Helicobacter suis]